MSEHNDGPAASEESRVPELLDALLRELHTFWCDDKGGEWHRSGADPQAAATALCMALWDMSVDGTVESAAALERLSAFTAPWLLNVIPTSALPVQDLDALFPESVHPIDALERLKDGRAMPRDDD